MADHTLKPVCWTEGMFLRPQHLQHEQRFAEQRLRYHLRALNPFHWGVRELVVDEEALSDNRFEVLRLEAVMPGGGIVRFPGNAVLEPREFSPSAEAVNVYLALHNLSATEANAASADAGVRDVRYHVSSEELPDQNRGGFEAPVELAQANLRLFLSGEEPELEVHEAFKLAEVRGTGQLKQPFALSRAYVPPLLALEGSPLLSELVASIVSQMAAKLRVVAGRTTTFALSNVHLLWMRYTLARMTGVLRHLLSTGHSIPFDVYTELVETAASLGTFRHAEPLELPLYAHEDLWGCFKRLVAIIEEELDAAAPSKFHEFPLVFDRASRVYANSDLKLEHVDPRNVFYLGVKAPIDAKELARWVVEEGKASSRSGVPPLVMLNTAGLRLEHLAGNPTEIATLAGYQYFKVDPRGQQWAKVREEFSFGLSLGKLEHAEARLYVVLP
jgi:type VI secretion system protein ImpJ